MIWCITTILDICIITQYKGGVSLSSAVCLLRQEKRAGGECPRAPLIGVHTLHKNILKCYEFV